MEERINVSSITYFGKEYTLEEVILAFSHQTKLIQDMRKNGSKKFVHIFANDLWLPMVEGDIAVVF